MTFVFLVPSTGYISLIPGGRKMGEGVVSGDFSLYFIGQNCIRALPEAAREDGKLNFSFFFF